MSNLLWQNNDSQIFHAVDSDIVICGFHRSLNENDIYIYIGIYILYVYVCVYGGMYTYLIVFACVYIHICVYIYNLCVYTAYTDTPCCLDITPDVHFVLQSSWCTVIGISVPSSSNLQANHRRINQATIPTQQMDRSRSR